MQYAFPYLALTILLGLLAFIFQRLDNRLRARMPIVCFVIMVVFFALRGFVGDDWVGYHPVYIRVQVSDIHLDIWNSHGWRYEPGFTVLVYFCRAIGGEDGFLFFQGICSVLQLLLLFRFFRIYSQNLPLTLYTFLAMGGFLMLINAMRNTLSIAIVLNALPYLMERRPIPYFLLCLLAISFHASAVIFIPMYFLLHRHYPRWVFLMLFVAGNCIVLFHIPLISGGISFVASLISSRLDTMVTSYLNDSHMASKSFVISIGYLERLFTGTLLLIYYDRLIQMRRHNVLFINAFILFFCFYFFFSEIFEVGRRLSDLFIFAYWILWFDLLRCFQRPSNRILYACFIGLYCSIKVFGLTGYPNTRYENILFGHTSYEVRLVEHTNDVKVVRNEL